MAPANSSNKRVKGLALSRPFVYGTIARLFDDVTNPKPANCPPDHTHSWTVFVKGVDDTDITYWCKKVQFKLHESIANPLRMVEVAPGEAFEVHETGWGEFEITIKLYYVPEANEKPQTIYHHLRLHPYGDTEKQKEDMKVAKEVTAIHFEEQIFNDPYESFFELMTTPLDRSKGAKGSTGKGTRVMQGGMVGSVGERTASIPLTSRPGQPFSRETERNEIKRLKGGIAAVEQMMQELVEQKEKIERETAELKASMG
jgi:YEATS domain-containing protein 4